MPDSKHDMPPPTTVNRLETILRKIVEHADDGMNGSHTYARDRLEQIRKLASYGVERVIGHDIPEAINGN